MCGGFGGLGVLLFRLGALGGNLPLMRELLANGQSIFLVVCCLVLGLVVLLFGGGPLLAFAIAAAFGVVIRRQGQRGGARRNEVIAEAVAIWTEQLRDTLAAAHGLQQTLVATAPHAPAEIARSVQRLVAKLPYAPMASCFREFADEVDHPSADLVCAALIAATEHEARDVGALLGHLAACSREEARMHQRIWVGRARTRTAVRIITLTVLGFIGALFVLNRDYLAPYSTGMGQLVLSGIVGVFVLALLMLDKGSRVAVPERFLESRQ